MNSAHEFLVCCASCNKPMTTRNKNGAGRYRKTCSPECKRKFDTARKPKKDLVVRLCDYCDSSFSTAFDHQRFCSSDCRIKFTRKNNATKSTVYFYSCHLCNTQFTRKVILRGAASENGIKCDACRKEAERVRYRKKTLKRQKSIANPAISLELVAKRDGYVCHLCNDLVDMSIPRTEKFGATIDHIQPLSKGGLDTLENVALAHWICNIKKGNRV